MRNKFTNKSGLLFYLNNRIIYFVITVTFLSGGLHFCKPYYIFVTYINIYVVQLYIYVVIQILMLNHILKEEKGISTHLLKLKSAI